MAKQVPQQMQCGGYGSTEEATGGFVILCYQLKTSAQVMLSKVFDTFVAISYRSQVVAGTNYIFKVHVGGESYIHMKVFWALPCYGGAVQLVDIKECMTKTDPIVPF